MDVRRLGRFLPWFLAFCLILLPIAGVGAGSGLLPLTVPVTTVSIDGPSEVAVGSSFTVDVAVDHVDDFDSVSFDVVYDESVISVTDVTGGEIDGHAVQVAPGFWSYIPMGPDDTGRIRVIADAPGVPGPGVTGSGYVARVYFDVLGLDGDSSDIRLEGLAMYDFEAKRIDTTTMDGAVEVVAPLVITACGAAPSPTKVGYSTTFSVTASGGVSPYTYTWDFGDGSGTSTDASPSYTYSSAGTWTVTVTVTDDEGDSKQCSFDLVVHPALSVTGAEATPPVTKVGHPTNFSVTVTGGVGEYTYQWNFGDGNNSPNAAPTHSYDAAGTYTVKVTVTDELLNEDDYSFSLVVNPPLEITSVALPDGQVGDEYSTILEATGGVTPYNWEAIGLPAGLTCSADGIISGTPIGEVGEFTVTITVACALLNTDSIELTITILCKPGDVNMDGVVDSGDLTKVRRIYFGLDDPTPCADVNGDGFVDAGDITAIRIIMFGD